jgi:hypothetical protein
MSSATHDKRRIRVEPPTPEAIKSLEEDGMEIELTPLKEANIVLTESAREVGHSPSSFPPCNPAVACKEG